MNFFAARPWLTMALIFVLGGITGALLTIGLGPRFGPPGPQEMRNHWMHHLAWRLDLNSDQQAKIEPIVRQAEDDIQSVHRDDVARISGIMEKANAQIKPLLTADQQAELQRMETERERMFYPHMRGPGGPFHEHGPDEQEPGDRPPGPPPDEHAPAPASTTAPTTS